MLVGGRVACKSASLELGVAQRAVVGGVDRLPRSVDMHCPGGRI